MYFIFVLVNFFGSLDTTKYLILIEGSYIGQTAITNRYAYKFALILMQFLMLTTSLSNFLTFSSTIKSLQQQSVCVTMSLTNLLSLDT